MCKGMCVLCMEEVTEGMCMWECVYGNVFVSMNVWKGMCVCVRECV